MPETQNAPTVALETVPPRDEELPKQRLAPLPPLPAVPRKAGLQVIAFSRYARLDAVTIVHLVCA